jgi:hypothetical protein
MDIIGDGAEGIRQVGHREHVGGLWDEMGRLQLEFLVARGLQPGHCLLDIGCGCLRGGVHFVRYLAPGNYLGMEKEELLVRAGLEIELGAALVRERRPHVLVDSGFEFGRFGRRPDFALAQSVFTHLPGEAIERCLAKLLQVAKPETRFFATYFLRTPGSDQPANPDAAHDWAYFAYTREEMEGFGAANGWLSHYLGEWNHPRDQKMVCYTPAAGAR